MSPPPSLRKRLEEYRSRRGKGTIDGRPLSAAPMLAVKLSFGLAWTLNRSWEPLEVEPRPNQWRYFDPGNE